MLSLVSCIYGRRTCAKEMSKTFVATEKLTPDRIRTCVSQLASRVCLPLHHRSALALCVRYRSLLESLHFASLEQVIDETEQGKLDSDVQGEISLHLQNLHDSFHEYFSVRVLQEEEKCVRDPLLFEVNENMAIEVGEQLIELQSNNGTCMEFGVT